MGKLRPLSPGGKLQASKVSIHGFLLERTGLRLGLARCGDAARCLPPMIKHSRDVADPDFRFTHPEHEFEVLDAIERRIESRGLGQIAAQTEEMPEIHRASKIFRRPVRFEKWLDPLAGRIIQFVLVRIDDVIALTYFFSERFQGRPMEQVVMIQETDVVAFG